MEASGQLHTLDILSPGKEAPVPTEQEGGWSSEPVWMWELNLSCPPHSLVIILNELLQVLVVLDNSFSSILNPYYQSLSVHLHG
jgi:hypothetical protein